MQEHSSNVFVIATANDVRGLPPELLRRFDDIFWVDLPVAAEREEILNIHLTRRGRNPADFDCAAVAKATPDFTGAEIEKVVKTALVAGYDDGARPITTDDLLQAATEVVPVARTMDAKIGELREWAKTRARAASSMTDATPARVNGTKKGAKFSKIEL